MWTTSRYVSDNLNIIQRSSSGFIVSDISSTKFGNHDRYLDSYLLHVSFGCVICYSPHTAAGNSDWLIMWKALQIYENHFAQ